MGIESIIAQRIAAASQQRARLEASNFGLQPLQEGLDSVIQQRQYSAQYGLQKAQYDENMKPLPEGMAGLAAESLTPAMPSVPGVVGSPGLVAGLAAKRAASVATLTSALGAQSASKALAMIAMLSHIHERNQADALAKMKLTSDLADGVAGGKPKEPRDPSRSRGMIAALTARGIDTTGLSEDMDPSDISSILVNEDRDSQRKGVADRFTMTFAEKKKAREDAKAHTLFLEGMANKSFAEGRKDEGLQLQRQAAAEAEKAIQEFVNEHPGMRKTQKAFVTNPTTGAFEETDVTFIDPAGANLTPEDRAIYDEFKRDRDRLRRANVDAAPQTTTIADYNAPPRMGEYAAPVGEPRRMGDYTAPIGGPKGIVEQGSRRMALAQKVSMRLASPAEVDEYEALTKR